MAKNKVKRHREANGTGVVPPPRPSIIDVTPESAMSLAAVYRAVSIIATTAGQMPLNTYRQLEPTEIKLAKRPDVDMTYAEFMIAHFTCMALHGESFWWATFNDREEVVNLTLLSPVDVEVQLYLADVGYNTRYFYRGREVSRRNLRHVKLLSLPGEPRGIGPIQAAKADIKSALRVREYGDAVYETGQVPTGVLSSDQFLSQAQADEYRDRWNERMRDRGIAVLGSGLSYSPILLSPEDAQFIGSQQWGVTQVARLFGIPTLLLASGVDGTSLTYSNGESLFQQMLVTCLSQYLNTTEDAFTDLIPRGQNARFKVDVIMRADITSRVGAYEKLVAMGAMLPQEVRVSEGMDPLTTGRYPDNEAVGSDTPPVPGTGPSQDGSPT